MRWKIAAGVVLALVIIIQLVPVARTNPPSDRPIVVPDTVGQILRRACYDCHSHETRWPWYAYVAPMSWLVASDVKKGREHVNFSTWGHYDSEEQAEKLGDIWEEVEDGEMPLKIYLPLHPDARLSDDDREILRMWTARRIQPVEIAPDSTESTRS